jgi:hypothetical protein
MKRTRETYRQIRDAVIAGLLGEEFTPAEVNRVLGIDWAGVFLPKHRVGNPRRETELFVRISSRPALYRLVERWSTALCRVERPDKTALYALKEF